MTDDFRHCLATHCQPLGFSKYQGEIRAGGKEIEMSSLLTWSIMLAMEQLSLSHSRMLRGDPIPIPILPLGVPPELGLVSLPVFIE